MREHTWQNLEIDRQIYTEKCNIFYKLFNDSTTNSPFSTIQKPDEIEGRRCVAIPYTQKTHTSQLLLHRQKRPY